MLMQTKTIYNYTFRRNEDIWLWNKHKSLRYYAPVLSILFFKSLTLIMYDIYYFCCQVKTNTNTYTLQGHIMGEISCSLITIFFLGGGGGGGGR